MHQCDQYVTKQSLLCFQECPIRPPRTRNVAAHHHNLQYYRRNTRVSQTSVNHEDSDQSFFRQPANSGYDLNSDEDFYFDYYNQRMSFGSNDGLGQRNQVARASFEERRMQVINLS